MQKTFLKFEIGMSGTGFSTHNFDLDRYQHSDSDIRSLVKVILVGLFQTEVEKELSDRYLKISGKNDYVLWTSKKIQATNPELDSFDIPEPFYE